MRNKYIILSFILPVLSSCEADSSKSTANDAPVIVPADEIIRIPVVIHIVNYSPKPFDISEEQVHSQIDVLNQDYRKRNTDWQKTPSEFIDLVADVGIEFVLATVDPEGNPTGGIIRNSSQVTGWDGKLNEGEMVKDKSLYFSEQGGQDAWPDNSYLNIWIADLSDRHGNLGLAGYANPPGSDYRMDGVVIDPRVFGTLSPINQNHSLGRTATHEIGHWLNLRHIYGTDGSCEDDAEHGDLVDDTPFQQSQNLGNPTHPVISCGNINMFMNFMDRVDDQSMYMFTHGQKQRIRELFNEGGARRDMYLTIRKK